MNLEDIRQKVARAIHEGYKVRMDEKVQALDKGQRFSGHATPWEGLDEDSQGDFLNDADSAIRVLTGHICVEGKPACGGKDEQGVNTWAGLTCRDCVKAVSNRTEEKRS